MIKIGCQTYTWQMLGDTYIGKLDHIIDVAGRCGFQGVEPEMRFLGALHDPLKMHDHLQAAGIELASLCIVEDWRGASETKEERASADWAIAFLGTHFPNAILNVCPMPGADRADLRERQDNQLSCMNALAARAGGRGIRAAYHPNSPAGSACRTAEDYDRMLNGLKADVLAWVPDAGHIAKGGMNVLDLVRQYRPLVSHVHYKDMSADGEWTQMGEGTIDFERITRYLADTGYQGWIVVEDESPKAEENPDAVAAEDAVYMRRLMQMCALAA